MFITFNYKSLVAIVPLPAKSINEHPIIETPPSEFFDTTSKPTVDTLISEFISKNEGKHVKKPSKIPKRLSKIINKPSKDNIFMKVEENNLSSPLIEKVSLTKVKIDIELDHSDIIDEAKSEFEIKSPTLVFEAFPLSEEEISESLIKNARSNMLHALIETHNEIKSIRESFPSILPFPFNLSHSTSFDNLYGFNISSEELFIDDIKPQINSQQVDITNIVNNITPHFMNPFSGFSLKFAKNSISQVCSQHFTKRDIINPKFVAKDKLIVCFKQVIESISRIIELIEQEKDFFYTLNSSFSFFQTFWIFNIIFAALSLCIDGYANYEIFSPIYSNIVGKCNCKDLIKEISGFEFCIFHFIMKLSPFLPQPLSLLFVLKFRLFFLLFDQTFLNSFDSIPSDNKYISCFFILINV